MFQNVQQEKTSVWVLEKLKKFYDNKFKMNILEFTALWCESKNKSFLGQKSFRNMKMDKNKCPKTLSQKTL
jgi:hypothetical protein